MKRSPVIALICLFVLGVAVTVVLGQETSPTHIDKLTGGHGPKDNELVPAWLFYWLLGIGAAVITGMVAAMRVLWTSLTGKLEHIGGGLSVEQVAQLKELRDAHLGEGSKDVDGIHRWYVPRAWGDQIAKMTAVLERMEGQLAHSGDLQQRLDTEQTQRREEAERLLREQNDLMREVMVTCATISKALEDNTRALERIAVED